MPRILRYVGPPLVVFVLAAVGLGGYWYAKLRERASAGAVQAQVAASYPSAHITCDKLSSNGATWACAVVYHAESDCALAKVSVTGSISNKAVRGPCKSDPTLSGLIPKPTAAGVEADVARHTSAGSGLVCAPVPNRKTRWACAVRGRLASTCQEVRVVPWVPWKLHPVGAVCSNIPALRHARPA